MRNETWAQGRLVAVETIDLDTGYTRTDFAGNVLEQRPLTAAEVEMLQPPPTPAEQLRAEIAALPAPTLPADILDIVERALAIIDGGQ